jgi:hypothetical protein
MSRWGEVLYPEAFNGGFIRTHWNYENDLKDILERSGKKDDFIGKYKMRLRFLDEYREKSVLKRDWFEALKHTNKLYAIKIKDDKNIRILFSFVEYKGTKYAILLHAFEEKKGKRKSPTSYDTAIPIAQQRLKEVLE